MTTTRSSLAFALSLFLSIVARAEVSVGVQGDWALALPEEQARARIERAIGEATAGMGPIVEGIAAGRLRERTPVVRRVQVRATEQRILVRLDERAYDTVPGHPAGAPSASSGEDRVEVVQHVRAGRLEQVFTTERGRRWNTFTLGPDGQTMTMEVVVQSGRLPRPVRFALPYRRSA